MLIYLNFSDTFNFTFNVVHEEHKSSLTGTFLKAVL